LFVEHTSNVMFMSCSCIVPTASEELTVVEESEFHGTLKRNIGVMLQNTYILTLAHHYVRSKSLIATARGSSRIPRGTLNVLRAHRFDDAACQESRSSK
jgi:hypothetical protein